MASEHCIAFFQGIAKTGDVDYNLSKMKEEMLKAAEKGAELVIFPELFTSSYTLSNADMRRAAEEKSGHSFQELSAAAARNNIAVLYGYPEVDSSTSTGSQAVYNSIQLIDRDGRSLVNYRKLNLWIDESRIEEVFTAGSEYAEVVECCGMKIGLLICYDVDFPESVRTLALRGAQLVAIPTASSLEYNGSVNIASKFIPTRAMENRVHVAYVNHVGGPRRFAGLSSLCNPAGDVVVSAGLEEDALVIGHVKLGAYDNLHSYLASRRPELYRELVN